jgi:hypothetical protein
MREMGIGRTRRSENWNWLELKKRKSLRLFLRVFLCFWLLLLLGVWWGWDLMAWGDDDGWFDGFVGCFDFLIGLVLVVFVVFKVVFGMVIGGSLILV